jgi:hypothetical protein
LGFSAIAERPFSLFEATKCAPFALVREKNANKAIEINNLQPLAKTMEAFSGGEDKAKHAELGRRLARDSRWACY